MDFEKLSGSEVAFDDTISPKPNASLLDVPHAPHALPMCQTSITVPHVPTRVTISTMIKRDRIRYTALITIWVDMDIHNFVR